MIERQEVKKTEYDDSGEIYDICILQKNDEYIVELVVARVCLFVPISDQKSVKHILSGQTKRAEYNK